MEILGVSSITSLESNVDSQKLRTGTLTDADWDAVVEGIGTIGSSKLVIDDTPCSGYPYPYYNNRHGTGT